MLNLEQCYNILGDPSGPLEATKSSKKLIYGPKIGVLTILRGLLWPKGPPLNPETYTTLFHTQID